jgi:toxin ParE1/3/4
LRIIWTKLASVDLDEIEQYIGQDSPPAAVRVILELIDKVETILLPYPAAGKAGRLLGTRELVIGSLPYIIAYRVRESDIEILRVLHTSRRWPTDF